MSSRPMGDAQPEAVAGADQTLTTGIVDNTAGPPEGSRDAVPEPEPARKPETAAEPAAEPAARAEPDAEPEPETEPEREPEEPDEALTFAEEAELDEPVVLIEMYEPVELAEPVEEAPPRRRWRAVLVGLLFVVAACAIVGGAFAIVGSLTHGFKKPVIIHYKKSAIFSLLTGECIDPNGQQAASVIPCTTPHEAEVFATFTLPASKWPGEAAVQAAASSGCAGQLTGYLNPQLAISLSTTYIYPDSVAWQAGTRKVICEVHAASGQLTGSVRGATATSG